MSGAAGMPERKCNTPARYATRSVDSSRTKKDCSVVLAPFPPLPPAAASYYWIDTLRPADEPHMCQYKYPCWRQIWLLSF